MATLTVGLTGGLASGKSTVATQLASAGIAVVDADRLVAELYGAGAPGACLVGDLFGAEFLAADGSVDKPALARKIFSDEGARARLEAAIHPLVGERFRQLAAATDGAIVLEATKLVESGWDREFDLVVAVEAPEELRLRRAAGRNLPPLDAEQRIAAQGSEALRRSRADLVIENAGSLGELSAQVEALAAEIHRRAAGAAGSTARP